VFSLLLRCVVFVGTSLNHVAVVVALYTNGRFNVKGAFCPSPFVSQEFFGLLRNASSPETHVSAFFFAEMVGILFHAAQSGQVVGKMD